MNNTRLHLMNQTLFHIETDLLNSTDYDSTLQIFETTHHLQFVSSDQFSRISTVQAPNSNILSQLRIDSNFLHPKTNQR